MASSSIHSEMVAPVAGRSRELADIDAVIDSARSGQARVVLLSGEPGIGKSRLLLHAATQARDHDMLVLRGNCYEDAELTPYGPFVEILRDLTRQQPDITDLVDRRDDLSILAALAPEVDRSDVAALSTTLSEVEQRQRLCDAYGRLLVRASARRPTALLIDDLHWADGPSAHLLRYLTRALRHSGAAIFCAYRDTDLDQGDPFERVLIDLAREHLARRVVLRRLGAAATAEIVTRVLDTRPGNVAANAVESIQRESEGVPFFVEELTLHLREEGLLRPAEAGVWDLDRNAESFVPQSVRGVISRRLARLDPLSSDLLAVAAVSGREFETAIICEVAARRGIMDEARAVAALREAVDRRLVVERDQTFMFVHEQIREVLYQGIHTIRRRQLHQLTAEAIERRHGDDTRLASRLAYHFSHGDDLDRAMRYTVRAAEEAARVHAIADATRLYGNALDILDVIGEEDGDRQRFDVLLARDSVLAAAGAHDQRSPGVDAMLRIGPRLDARADAEAHARAASFAIQAGSRDLAIARARDAVRLAGVAPSRVRLEALLALGEASVMRPMGEPSPLFREVEQTRAALEVYRAASDVAVALGDVIGQARIAQEIGVLEWAALDGSSEEVAERARGRLLEALEGFRSVGDRKGEVTALIALAYRRDVSSSSRSNDPRESYVSFLEEIRRLRATEHRLSRASERPRMDALALLSIELYCRSNGWYEVGLQRARQALALAEEARDSRLALIALVGLSETERLLGRIPRAIEHAERAMATIDMTADIPLALAHHRDRVELSLAAAHALAGDAARALSAAQSCVQRALVAGPPARLAEALVGLAEVAETTNNHQLADQNARQALQVASGMAGGITWDIRAELVLARLALAAGEVNLALGHASAASGKVAQRDVPLTSLQIAVDLARGQALLAAGFDDDARESFSSAYQRVSRIADRIGDPSIRETFLTRSPVAKEVVALAARLGFATNHSDGSAPTNDARDPLTKREVEVLRQVAAGLPNREIADRLFISEKTVARHLTNIFTKLDVESRTQAAAWAFRQGIA